ncbi:hypothetical protein [Levilactobacillus yiduensis]|uniref:hypothetical protein n=1 Tax=Levilactobacillus yiduensis TaxID=2953880 RepID=UPI000EF2B53D|nr:hypothetical protein [Levilactobacillus yiduensis]AYM02379.1 hypothetical protein D8911_04970 [Levilactobacillus brevis]
MKKMLIGLAVLATVATVGGSQLTTPTTAQAKAKTTLKTLPKRYRHTWYHYANGKLSTLTFSKRTIAGRTYYAGDQQATKYLAHIHAHKLTATKFHRHISWSSVVPVNAHHSQWLNVRGWNQVMGDGDFYRVMTKTVRGKRVQVLSQAGGAGVWTAAHYYQSKQVAKQRGNKHFSGEVYYK